MGGEAIGEHHLEEPDVKHGREISVGDRRQLSDDQFGHCALEPLAVEKEQIGLGDPVEAEDIAGEQVQHLCLLCLAFGVSRALPVKPRVLSDQMLASGLLLDCLRVVTDALDALGHFLKITKNRLPFVDQMVNKSLP